MNTAFAGNFGISIAFPVDYGDMFWIDAKGMEPFINWFGFMAYDLKNPDGTVTAQTDILKIQNDALPLWFDGLDPGNINLGLASYGRGFTLAGKNARNTRAKAGQQRLTDYRYKLQHPQLSCQWRKQSGNMHCRQYRRDGTFRYQHFNCPEESYTCTKHAIYV